MSTRSRRLARGYTVVEVMSAMTLFAIGAAGVISMQRVTIQGGEDARRLDVATNLANQWSFRLSRDASYWVQPNGSTPPLNGMDATVWLKTGLPSNTTPVTTWQNPPSDARGTGTFDLWGRDRAAGDGTMFCAQYRTNWLSFVGPTAAIGANALLKTEVRVVWARLDRANIPNCSSFQTTDALDPTIYHSVYVTSAVRPGAQ